MRLGSAILYLLFSTALLSPQETPQSGTAPPPRFPLDTVPAPTMKSVPASRLLLGNIKIIFDRTTLGQAMEQIKAGEIRHQGDAAESVYWLCYSNRTTTGWEQIWLLSHGEMGGDEHVIHGVAAKVSFSRPPESSCPVIPQNLRPVKLNNGLWLGAGTKEVIKKLGKPSFQNENWLHYQSLRKLAGDPRAKAWGTDAMYERGGVSLGAADEKVVEIWATKQTTD